MKGKIVVAAVVLAFSGILWADTYVWTGAAGDGRWMTAGNWSVGGSTATRAPGVPESEVTRDEEGKTYFDTITAEGLARLGENVEFGPIENGSTTIDFDGLYSINSITVKAGSPTYTFGTSSDQVIPIQQSGNLTLESGLENMPVLVAAFSLGTAVTVRDPGVTINNNTGRELVIGNYGMLRCQVGKPYEFGFPSLYLRGTGMYKFTGTEVKGIIKNTNGVKMWLYASKMTVASPSMSLNKLYLCNSDVECEILEGSTLLMEIGLNGIFIEAQKDARITGKGKIDFVFSNTVTGTNRGHLSAYSGYTLTIEASLCVRDKSAPYGRTSLCLYGDSGNTGTVYIKGENTSEGKILFITGDRTLKTNHLGGFGSTDTAEFYSNGQISPAYTNGEDFVMNLAVANGFMATIINERETTMTARPTVKKLNSDDAAATLCSKPVTAPIILDPTLTEGQAVTLGVAGTKETKPTAALLGAVVGVRLMGGILDASAVPNWSPSVPVTYDTGNATIVVPDGEVYVLPSSLGRTAGQATGTLNIVCGTGRAKIDGASAGAAPAGLKVNGFDAEIREGGVIAPVTPATDVQIAARGDEVPNAPTSSIGITTDGTGGNDTIELGSTAVKELVHIAAADATIEIGEGRNLSAGKVRRTSLAGRLDIGVSGDLGTFGTGGESVLLQNDDELSDLSVNAKLADRLRVVVDGSAGAPVIAGGSVATNELLAKAGTLKVSGERRFLFDFAVASTNRSTSSANPEDWPTIKFDGAKDVIIGERGLHAPYKFATGYSGDTVKGRIVVTNSLIRSDDVNRAIYPFTNDTSQYLVNEKYSIIVGNRASGVMDIQKGAVITNRLIVGSPFAGHRGLGAVYQEDGEVAALSNYGSDLVAAGSGVGISYYGSYSLSGGNLTALGPFAVGCYSRGIFRQTGGHFTATNHPADTAASPRKRLYVGSSNNGDGLFWISGGKCDVFDDIDCCGGSYGYNSSAKIIVDGDAVLDVHDSRILMIMLFDGALSKPHHSYFCLNSGGTVRAEGFCDFNNLGGEARENRFVAVSFNGGTFKPSIDKRGVFHCNYKAMNYLPNSGGPYSVDHVYVYEGGMKIDTDGKTGIYIDSPLEGATGGGVASINFAPTTKQSTYHLPPMVEIIGDGFGAVAAVEWDEKTKNYKGVTIAAPGVNYTWAKAIVRLGTASLESYVVTNDCTIVQNANTGSFTKKGEGDLTLAAVNTYGGDTILAGGVLRIAANGALPDGSALVPQGGILEVASGVTLPSAITVKLDNPDPAVRYNLIRFLGGVPETLPTFTVVGEGSNGWSVRQRDEKLVVSRPRGFLLIAR